MKARKDFPNMYFETFTDYPNCKYDIYNKHYINPHHSNSMTVYSFYLKDLKDNEKYTIISPIQPLMVVNCIVVDEWEVKDSFFCQFETSIFTDQYLLKGEKDSYTISLLSKEKIKKVYLDLIVLSGNVDFQIETNIEAHKYFLSNKIFCSIQVKEGDTKVDFYVKAERIHIVYDEEVDDSKNENYIEGVNYINSILIGDNDKYSNCRFKNMRFFFSSIFVSTKLRFCNNTYYICWKWSSERSWNSSLW